MTGSVEQNCDLLVATDHMRTHKGIKINILELMLCLAVFMPIHPVEAISLWT